MYINNKLNVYGTIPFTATALGFLQGEEGGYRYYVAWSLVCYCLILALIQDA